jgi:hypothetical protein
VIGWLAIAPKVQVDTEHEADLGPKAERLIPIHIVMLNSSYQDADLPSTENNSIWRLEVRDSSQQIIGQWRLDVGLGDHVLGPAEFSLAAARGNRLFGIDQSHHRNRGCRANCDSAAAG